MTRKKLPIPFNARFIILALLAEKEDYGTKLIERAKQKTDGRISLEQATLYPLLECMSSRSERLIRLCREERGPSGGRPVKIYAIAKKGEAALREHLTLMGALLLPRKNKTEPA